MKVHVDPEKCQGHTLCAMRAPGLFELSETDGHSSAVAEAVPAAEEADALDRDEEPRSGSSMGLLAGIRLVLFTTRARTSYLDHAFRPEDVLLFGRESAGVPEPVHQAADARLLIPMRLGLRSLNVAMAAAMAVGEATRQLGAAPSSPI